jgi:valyl-tRNA synthetase
MSDIPKAYEPRAVETRWYTTWEESGFFTANPASPKPAYSIVIPPPNVTGVLHMGHVLNNTIQDILARKARMEGFEVLWLPGTDHAGIATQAVVEKTLRKQGLMKHREDLGREKFLEHVWAWKEKHGNIIIQQLKRLGCSCDWSRLRFTMDPDYSRCVQKVFVALFRDGLIYRGLRMVNWDPAARTALSDEEVEWVEEKSHLWHLKYPLLDDQGRPLSDRHVVVATTRPETMLGDEAVAVHPADARYRDLVGRRVLLPLRNKPIPVIADEAVDPEFGTGCVKVTPAHDPADYEIALRHNLPFTVVIGPDGRMTPEAGDGFAGLDRMEARTAVVAHLEKLGFLVKVEDYTHRVGYSQRSHVPIEPRLSEQWFLRYPEVERARQVVEQGQIRFHPDRWVKTYTHWLTHLKDWCISRQLWWGHRIPVWTRTFPDTHTLEAALNQLPARDPETAWRRDNLTLIVATANPALQEQLTSTGWEQDPDVLDTWFSSWLWPFATMGWTGQPDLDRQNPTLSRFYPTTDLVTGPDIIFFWVARMIMAGLRFMNDVPFRNVYFTGIIRDKLGRKMSKSLGNSPDPLDLIDRYGADALRFGTMRSAPLGQDVLFDEKDVELGRNFCNKLWNACRFRQLQGPPTQTPPDPNRLTVDDRWILLKLDTAIREIHDAFAQYRFSEVTQTLYRFFWSEYCDWYVEAAKAVLHGNDPDQKQHTLALIDFVLEHTLRLFHPFLPHITEELWHGMGFARRYAPDRGGRTLMFAPWPRPLDTQLRQLYRLDNDVLDFVNARYALVTEGRNLRRLAGVPANRKVRFILKPTRPLDPHDQRVLELLLQAETIEIDPQAQPRRGTPTSRTALGDLYLPLEGVVDVAAETARLTRELEKIQGEISRLEQRLNDPQFQAKAPPHVLQEHQRRLAEWRDKAEHTRAALEVLRG